MEHLRVFNIAEMTAIPKDGWGDGQQVTALYYATADDGGGGTFWWNLGSSTTADGGTVFAADEGGTGRWKRIYNRGRVNVMWWNAKGDNSADDDDAINAACTAVATLGGTVEFPQPPVAYKMGTTLVLTDGIRLEGISGAVNRWRSSTSPVKINYTGSTAAVRVSAPASPGGIDSIQIVNLHFDGTGATGSVDGLLLEVTTGGFAYIEGILIDGSAFTNFPRHQVFHNGNGGGIFDITYRRTTLHNSGRAADDIVKVDDPSGSQILFDDCWIASYTSGKWGVNGVSGQGIRVTNGTITGFSGAHGINCAAGLWIYGTSVEGDAFTAGSVGICYPGGSNGAVISPSQCAAWATGVQIGTAADSSAARGWVLIGHATNNTVDLLITNGGNRNGAVVAMGNSAGAPVITDNRFTTDGVSDVVYAFERKLTAQHLLNEEVSVANLTSASPSGKRQMVLDATTTTFASVVAGGGGNRVPVFSDGTNWRIG